MSVELPNHWKWAKLDEIAEINPKIPKREDISESLEVQFLPMKLVEELSGKIHLTETRLYSEVKKGYTPFINGDIIFAKVTPCMENGKIAVVENLKNKVGFGSSEFHVVRSKKDLFNKFAFYYLIQQKFRSDAEHAMTGAVGLRRVPKQFIESYKFPLPSIETQQEIVAKIEELFSEIDKGVEELKAAQAQLKVYRQAVLKWAFEGKLTEEWRSRVRDRSGPQELSMVAEPKIAYGKSNELPEGWENTTIGSVCTSVEYGSAAKSKEQGKIPVLRMGNIQRGKFKWDDLVYTDDEGEINKYLLKKNDVLFNRTNSPELVGKTAIYKGERPAIFAGYLIRINMIDEKIDADYLTYYLNSKQARSYGNTVRSFGVNQSNINGTKLKSYPLPLPPLEEQQQIVQEIESRLSVCDKMEETITNSLQQAEALKQSILKQAFDGKLKQ